MKLVRRDLDLTSVEAARRIAKRKLPFSVYRFIEGGNEDEQTIHADREGFQEIGFRPRVPHDRLPRDLRTTVLGQELSMPVVISPAGFIRIAHPEGELAVARAAAAAGIAIGVSTLASYPIEAITAIAPDVWFQVYMVGGHAGTEIAVEHRREAGCRVLVITVDLAAGTGGSDRPSTNSGVPGRVDLRTALRYTPEMVRRPAWAINFVRGGLELAIPNAASGDGQPMSVAQGSAAIRESPPTWDDIECLRARWDGPFVIKGIVTGEDARRAVDVGADAVSVSNHGGNALDGGRPRSGRSPRSPRPSTAGSTCCSTAESVVVATWSKPLRWAPRRCSSAGHTSGLWRRAAKTASGRCSPCSGRGSTEL